MTRWTVRQEEDKARKAAVKQAAEDGKLAAKAAAEDKDRERLVICCQTPKAWNPRARVILGSTVFVALWLEGGGEREGTRP